MIRNKKRRVEFTFASDYSELHGMAYDVNL